MAVEFSQLLGDSLTESPVHGKNCPYHLQKKKSNFVIGQHGYYCRSGLSISLESVLLLQKLVDLIVFPQPAQSNRKDYQWER